MYGIYIYANIGDILMVNVTIYPYIAYMDPMGIGKDPFFEQKIALEVEFHTGLSESTPEC